MSDNTGFDYQKAVQAINFFARKYPSLRVNKMKALKLLWAADRYHLRKYGRPVTGDGYVAMEYGAVGSATRDILEKNSYLEGGDEAKYAQRYLEEDGYDVKSVEKLDKDVLSETDIESLKFAFLRFGDLDQWELAKLTHKYPEWKKFEAEFKSGRSTVETMQYVDFFKNPAQKDDKFEQDQKILQLSMEIFEESSKERQQWL